MANTPGAKKAVRKIARRTEVNKARRSRVRTYLRKFEEAVASGDAGAAKDAFVVAQSELMRAVTRCTTLVKLPVALSGGRRAKRAPEAGARLRTWP